MHTHIPCSASSKCSIHSSFSGSQLNVNKRLSLDGIKRQYFMGLTNLPKNKEIKHNNHYYCYAELRPTKDNEEKFSRLLLYLSKKSVVCLLYPIVLWTESSQSWPDMESIPFCQFQFHQFHFLPTLFYLLPFTMSMYSDNLLREPIWNTYSE